MKPWEKYASGTTGGGGSTGDFAPAGPWEQYQVRYDPRKTAKNFGPSLMRAGADMASAVTHPIDTATAMGKLAIGGIQNLPAAKQITEPLRAMGAEIPDQTETADAFWDMQVKRYGSIDAIKRTAMEDPGGMALEIIGGVGSLPGKVGKVAAAMDPFNIAKNTAATGIKALPNIENSMAQTVNKFSTTLDPDQAHRMTETQLNKQIMPTSKGGKKLEGMINKNMRELDDILIKAQESGKGVNKAKLLGSLQRMKGGLSKQSTPQYDKRVAELDSIINEYTEQWAGIDTIDAPEALALKRNLDRSINWKKVNQSGTEGAEAANVELRGAARTELEGIDPKVGPLNDDTASMLELYSKGKPDGIERTMRRLGNNNNVPLRSAIAIGTGLSSGTPVGMAAGGAAAVGMLPLIQAKTALFIRKIKNSPLKDVYLDGNGKLTQAGRLALMEIERTTREEESNPLPR